MKKPVVAEKLIDYIEERILSGDYPVNSRIPSLRRLAAKFQISYSSAMRAINYLQELNKVTKTAKCGVYVSAHIPADPAANNSGRKIVFFISKELDADYQSLWYTTLLGVSECAAANGDKIVISQLPLDERCNATLLEQSASADGMIIFNSSDWPLRSLPKNIAAVGSLLDSTLDNSISVVNIDPVDAARCATDYFRRKKIDHVIILTNPKEAFAMRGRIFAAFFQAAGGRCEMSAELPDSYSDECGYLFTSDHLCQTAHMMAGALGKTLPKDAAIILSIDGKRILRPDFYTFPTIAVNWRQIGHCLYHELDNLMRNPSTPRKTIGLCGKLTSEIL